MSLSCYCEQTKGVVTTLSLRATEGSVAISLFYEIATSLRSSRRLRRIATPFGLAMTLLLLRLYR